MNKLNTINWLKSIGLLKSDSTEHAQTAELTGNVIGNVAGNSAGTHTGPVVGDVTGNLKATGLTGTLHASAPTQTELVALLGSAATAGAFAVRVAKRTSGDMFFCVSDGTNWYRALAAVGA